MYKRLLDIDNEYNDSVLLFGARQTEKTTWLTSHFHDCRYYDLLRLSNSSVFSCILNFCPRNYKRKLNGIDILPVSDFLKDLWNGLVI